VKEILFFSKNKNKISEIYQLFKNSDFKILNLADFKNINSPKETGNTFEENAKIKSYCGLINFKKICFGDDSGICINAMDDQPGIFSKNFLNTEKDVKIVLRNIISFAKNKNNFKAFFQTSICLSINENTHVYFDGKIYGKISTELKGVEGFGYDPIFIPNGHKLTFAEMGIKKKNSISHRAIAIKKLKEYLLTSF
tara:strand:- start:1870 stop:2457 length:588 start_codon:yes stop_codon:yes gene_type:complete